MHAHRRLRRPLDSFRRRFPTAYWRGRNAVALGEWWWARHQARDGEPGRDTYDDAFWDFHEPGDWEGLAALILALAGKPVPSNVPSGNERANQRE